jgi:integrase
LIDLSDSSEYLLPARKRQDRMLPHIHENTLNVAMAKVQAVLAAEGIRDFTIHDFRRTARTHMAALGVEPHVAERCLNHKIQGVAGVYDRHDYFDQRRAALETWAKLLRTCEYGGGENVIPIRSKPSVA